MGLMVLNLWVTTKCNFNCTYCYEKNVITSKKNMTYAVAYDTVKYIVNFLKKNRVRQCNINFHGGEPLLNDKVIWLIIDELRRKSKCEFKFSMTTNGSLLNSKLINKISMGMNRISVSIDGDWNTFQKNRGMTINEEKYNHILQNAIMTQAIGVDTIIRMTLIPEQVSLFFENIQFFLKKGLLKIEYALDVQNSVWSMHMVDILLQQIEQVREYILKNNIEAEIDGIEPEVLHNCGDCQGGINNLNIDVDGNIYPCVFSIGNKQFLIGDVYSGIDSAWFSELEKINQIEMILCNGCNFLPCCMGKKCKIFNYILTGSYGLTNENVCLFQHFKYKLSKLKALR